MTFTRSAAKRLKRLSTSDSRTLYYSTALVSTSSALLLWHNSTILAADGPPLVQGQVAAPKDKQAVSVMDVMQSRGMIAWGDNAYRVAAPDSDLEKVKKPRAVALFQDQALRDLVMHRTHAAAVDARGDVHQWGAGHDPECNGPQRTLTGLDIVRIAATNHKIYALSRQGRLYAFSSSAADQRSRPPMRLPGRWYWPFATGDAGIDVVELKAVAGLASGDRIVDFTTGDHHLVARTAKGRIYTSPVDLWANRWGQLGTRHVIAGGNRLELIPFGFGPGDPHPHEQPGFQGLSASYSIPSWWLDTPFAGKGKPVLLMRDPNTGSAPGESEKEREARFSEHLYPFEAMKDLDVVEVACGARHSLARLRDGRVVGWGANEHGQLGLGPMYNFPVLPVPAEIPLFRAYEIFGGRELPSVECTSVRAGADTSYFVTNRSEVRWIGERDAIPTKRVEHYVDVLACGQGRSGEIGDGQWLPRLYPTLLKNISSLREYSEQRKAVVPIPIKSLAAWHHAVAVLDTSSSATQEAVHGQDVYVWGRGYDFALGTGKRSNWALPSRLRLNSKTLEPDPSPYTAKPSYPFPSASKLQDISLPYSRLQLSGKVEVRGGKKCEETVCVGPSTTAVYYRIVDS